MITEGTLLALGMDLARYDRATDDHEKLWIFNQMVSTVYEREPDLSIHQATGAVREMIRGGQA